jgi:DNA invertase Pin-like site-specific DNA recombinase
MSDTPKVRRIPAYRKDPHLIKAGIYVRVSTARVEQLRSLSNQVSAMTRYVYARENWVLKDIYLEVGSAKTGSSRREFTRLVDDCKKHQIETVVVKSLSRFGRDNVEVIESVRALISAGVTIYFMEEDIDVDASYPEWE